MFQRNATISIRFQFDKPRRSRSDMHGTLFVGLDVGTTTSKAVVFTAGRRSGRVRARRHAVDGDDFRRRTRRERPARSGQIRGSRSVGRLPARPDRRPRRGKPGRVRSATRPTRRARGSRHRLARHPRRCGAGQPAQRRWRTDILGDDRAAAAAAVVADKAPVADRQRPVGAQRSPSAQRRGVDRAWARR